jgi:hypothetical protein
MFDPPNAEATAVTAALPPPPLAYVPWLIENAHVAAEAALIAELALTFDLEALIAETCRDPFHC